MKILFLYLIGLTFFLSNAYSQVNSYYYDVAFGVTETEDDAVYKREVEQKSERSYRITTYKKEEGNWILQKRMSISLKGKDLQKIKSSGSTIFPDKLKRYYHLLDNGRYYFYDVQKKDTIRMGTASSLFPLHLEDTVKLFYPKNRQRSVAVYENNRLISNQNWLVSGKEYIPDIHYFVDDTPDFIHGQGFFSEYMMEGINESDIDLSQLRDKVIIGWVVDTDGKAVGFHVVNGMFRELNALLIQLLEEMPGDWKPATVQGEPVNYYMTIPFNFIEQTSTFEMLEMSSGFMIWD
jgi:hypothetical protein